MFFSDSPLRFLSLIMPLEDLRVLCGLTSTGRLKNFFDFKRMSVCIFLVVSTNNVPFF